jgi:hypothetical protein
MASQADLLARRFSGEDEVARALDLLVLRELIERAGEGYRFQVELIRRWFDRDDR